MTDIIVIGLHGETRGYCVEGLRCFEPALGHLVERVRAERRRCAILAMPRTAYDALREALAEDLRTGASPALAILPEVADAAAARVFSTNLARSLTDSRSAA